MVAEMAELLTIHDLPPNFQYPPLFIRVVELGLTDLEPWRILEGDWLRRRYTGLRKHYPERSLIPFAARQDCDDIACWEDSAGEVAIIHDLASPGWEQRATLPDFAAWLRKAIEDLIDFELTCSRRVSADLQI
jgi:hypothetical protein